MLENIISGIIGGLVVFLIDKLIKKIEDKKDSKKGRTPQNNNNNIIITDELIEAILPNRNYSKAKELFGIPDKTFDDYSIFQEEIDSTNIPKSDLYFLKNANLKITTLDEKKICSITIFSYDNKINIPSIYYPCEERSTIIGKATVCKSIINNFSNKSQVHTIRNRGFAIQNYFGAPFYQYITYFCFDNFTNANEPYEIKDFINQPIEGFCLSNIGSQAFYIFDYELR